jgi:hypothetical protein
MATPDKSAPVSAPNAAPVNPGDEAPAGTPGTGENVCPCATAPASCAARRAAIARLRPHRHRHRRRVTP